MQFIGAQFQSISNIIFNSATLELDTNNDGEVDTTVTLEGDFENTEFIVEEMEWGTQITSMTLDIPADEEDEPDDDEFYVEPFGETIYSQVFFAYEFDENGVHDIGVDIFLDAPEVDNEDEIVLSEGQDGFFDDYLDAFAQADGEVQLVESVFFYQEDDDGNLFEVRRLDAPEDGFQSIEQMLMAYLEMVEGALEDLDNDIAPPLPETPPVEADDDDEEEEESERDDNDARLFPCFVATAAYGDPQHPDVVYLRAFRDQWLRHRGWGRAFISLYWTIGPVLAKPVSRNTVAQRFSRATIAGIVRLISRYWQSPR